MTNDKGLSGVALKDFLSDQTQSYNIGDFDLLSGFRWYSRATTAADISGHASRRIKLRVPLITAPMPDVTDAHVAISAARHGALGIIPATHVPEEQAEIVRHVKKAEGGFIEQPFILRPDDKIATALDAPYSNIPVVENDSLIGMFFHERYGTLYYNSNRESPISEAMVRGSHLAVSVEDVHVAGELNFSRARELMEQRRLPALAVLGWFRELKYLVTMKDVSAREYYPLASRDSAGQLLVGAAIMEYMTDENKERIRLLADARVDVLVIYQAHGWNVDMGDMTKYLKREYPHIDVVSGNDSNGGAVWFHYRNGVDGVNVGQGPGYLCLTGEEDNVGVWRPQLSAVFDCAKEANEIFKTDGVFLPCIADGGNGTAYDAVRALAAGAWAVMIGTSIARTKDSPAQEVEPGKKLIRAMASPELVQAFPDAYQRYDPTTFIPEGTARTLTITSTFEEFVKRTAGLLQREFERIGARDMEDLHAKLRRGELRAQFRHERPTK